MRMGSSPLEALAFIVDVRWRLLESFALARQEGLVDPLGLVVDTSFPYGRRMGERLLLFGQLPSASARRATCVPRANLQAMLAREEPDLAEALRHVKDEPGSFAALVLAERGLLVTGTWQELITGQAGPRQGRRFRAV